MDLATPVTSSVLSVFELLWLCVVCCVRLARDLAGDVFTWDLRRCLLLARRRANEGIPVRKSTPRQVLAPSIPLSAPRLPRPPLPRALVSPLLFPPPPNGRHAQECAASCAMHSLLVPELPEVARARVMPTALQARDSDKNHGDATPDQGARWWWSSSQSSCPASCTPQPEEAHCLCACSQRGACGAADPSSTATATNCGGATAGPGGGVRQTG
jgi:hypothetical protein